MAGEYIYKNSDDSMRFKIFARYNQFNEWDVDIWTRNAEGNHNVLTVSGEAGDLFDTKKDAKSYIESLYGKIKSLSSVETVTEGWPTKRE